MRLRACVPLFLVLTLFIGCFASPPSEIRLELSEDGLNEVARTAPVSNPDDPLCSDPYASSTFRKRRVGLYHVVCAERIGNQVNLWVDEPFGSAGIPFLIGPGDWDTGIQD